MKTLAEQTPLHSKPGHVYVAGPMAGRPGHGFPAFQEATELLQELFPGVVVRSPHQSVPAHVVEEINLHGTSCLAYNNVMRRDICILLSCSSIVLLEDWSSSRGALFECEVARMVGLPAYELSYIKTHKDLSRMRDNLHIPTTTEIPYYGD